MGIEPTRPAFAGFNGFEDRGGHQTSKRFLFFLNVIPTPARKTTRQVLVDHLGFDSDHFR